MNKSISIIIRTLNEGRYLRQCITAIKNQNFDGLIEVVLVDSWSADSTVEIAKEFNCKILYLTPQKFTYGGALNLGIKNCFSDVVVVLSGHCVPEHDGWLSSLTAPLFSGDCHMTFGSQRASNGARTSERNHFKLIYENIPSDKRLSDYFNNANSAFLKKIWVENSFDEEIKAQEDVVFARYHQNQGRNIKFQKCASIVHYHLYGNKALYKRVKVDSEINRLLGIYASIGMIGVVQAAIRHFVLDLKVAYVHRKLLKAFPGIICYRGVELCATLHGRLNQRKTRYES